MNRIHHHLVRDPRTPCLRRARARPARVSLIFFFAIQLGTIACYLNHSLREATIPLRGPSFMVECTDLVHGAGSGGSPRQQH